MFRQALPSRSTATPSQASPPVNVEDDEGQSYLSIRLNHPPKHKFAPGDTITGVLVVTTFKPIQRPQITIALQGREVAAIGPASNRTIHNQDLFRKLRLLYESEEPLVPGTHSWPFQFVFPSHFTVKEHSIFAQSDKFVLNPGELKQVLAPTFSCSSEEGYGEIAYELKALVPKPVRPNVLLRDVVPVILAPPRPRPREPMLKLAAKFEKQYRIGSDGKARALTSSEQRKKDHPDNKKITQWIIVEYPSTITIGKPFDVMVELTAETNETVVPTFKIKFFNGTLAMDTYVRTPGKGKDTVATIQKKVVVHDGSHLNELLSLNTPITFSGLNFGQQLSQQTFHSYSVSMRCSLSIDIKVEILGGTDKFFIKEKDIAIIPERGLGDNNVTNTGEKGNPPRYEDAVSSQKGDGDTSTILPAYTES